MLDVLANKENESWRPYAGIFAAFAERDDKDFFECLVRARQRKGRKQIFSPLETFLMGNWLEWNDPPCTDCTNCPPLSFWTDNAVLDLFHAHNHDGMPVLRDGIKSSVKNSDLQKPGLEKTRQRLRLIQERPPKVLRFFLAPLLHGRNQFAIETAD